MFLNFLILIFFNFQEVLRRRMILTSFSSDCSIIYSLKPSSKCVQTCICFFSPNTSHDICFFSIDKRVITVNINLLYDSKLQISSFFSTMTRDNQIEEDNHGNHRENLIKCALNKHKINISISILLFRNRSLLLSVFFLYYYLFPREFCLVL